LTPNAQRGGRANRDAMWIGNTIYFNSDKNGHFNLYSYDIGSGKTTEVTHNKTFDVCDGRALIRENRIVYELNGELQVLDTKSQRTRIVDQRSRMTESPNDPAEFLRPIRSKTLR